MIELIIEGGELQGECGSLIAPCLVEGTTVFLEGDLGAGKTTLVRGVLRGLGYSGSVKSPTYTLVESYQPKEISVHHLDLYRLADPEELDYLGITDLCDGKSILLIEWPDKGEGMLPPVDLNIAIVHAGLSRYLTITAESERGNLVIEALTKSEWPQGVEAKVSNQD